MKRIVGLLRGTALVVLVCVGIWFCWTYQRWMPPGRAVHLSTEHIAEHDFQVWQRKNAGWPEPFATGLFARKNGGHWKAFLLDFQDNYRSSITLKPDGSGVVVLQDGHKLGLFDENQDVFKRDSDGAIFEGVVLSSEPPGNWWLEEAGGSLMVRIFDSCTNRCGADSCFGG